MSQSYADRPVLRTGCELFVAKNNIKKRGKRGSCKTQKELQLKLRGRLPSDVTPHHCGLSWRSMSEVPLPIGCYAELLMGLG